MGMVVASVGEERLTPGMSTPCLEEETSKRADASGVAVPIPTLWAHSAPGSMPKKTVRIVIA
ncbi:MAG: hypothetical protein QW104_05175 [Nitrososphaerota archaeon]